MYRLAALFLLLLTWPVAAYSLQAQEVSWPMFRHDVRHTGRADGAGPELPGLRWRFNLGGTGYSSPTIGADGTVYVGAEGLVFAVSASGEERWSAPVGDMVISSPTIGPGVIYVGSRDGNVYAFRQSDGSTLWTFTSGGEVWSSPAIGADGTVYVGSADGRLYALDPASGTPRWSVQTGAEVVSSPAIGPDGTIYFGSADGNVYAVTAQGASVWGGGVPTGDEVVSSPAVGNDGTIYVGSRDGSLYAISPNGAEVWRFETDGEIISSPAVGADGAIYVGSRDGRLYAVRPDGSQKWAPVQTEDEIFSSPAVDTEGTVYVGSLDGKLYAVDGGTGTVRWTYTASGAIWASPSIGSGRTVYFTANNEETLTGTLFAVGSAPFQVAFSEEPVADEPAILEVHPLTEPLTGDGLLFFRRGGERAFQPPVALTPSGNGSFQAEIPAAFSTLRGIEYYVQFGEGEEVVTVPIFEPAQRPAFQAVRVVQDTTDAALRPLRYHMVSVPLHLDQPSIDAVLADDYGAYQNIRWRLFRWEGGGYREYPNIGAAFRPGTSFFLITNDGRRFDVEDGLSVSTETPYEIVLQPGLNQIANPYAFPVAWSDVVLTPGSANVQVVATFDSQTNQLVQNPSQLQVLHPWTGYFVSNRSSRAVTVTFPTRESPQTAVEGDLLVAQPKLFVRTQAASEGSVINVLARIPGRDLVDTQNWIGFLPDAAPGEDLRDFVEVPPIGDFVQLSILEHDQRWAGNFRSTGSAGEQWDLSIRTSKQLKESSVPVEVTLRPEQTLPEGYAVRVIDVDGGRIVPVSDGRFVVELDRDTPERHVRVIVGTASYLQDPSHTQDLPTRFALEQNYPNPFNPETVIRYQVAEETRVEVAVYNMLGQRVRTLVDGVQAAGSHEVTWDGLDEAGHSVASGVYLYQLSAGSFRATRKMLLLR